MPTSRECSPSVDTQQVEAVEDLACLRCASPRALGEHVGAVARHDLDVGMDTQAGGDALGRYADDEMMSGELSAIGFSRERGRVSAEQIRASMERCGDTACES